MTASDVRTVGDEWAGRLAEIADALYARPDEAAPHEALVGFLTNLGAPFAIEALSAVTRSGSHPPEVAIFLRALAIANQLAISDRLGGPADATDFREHARVMGELANAAGGEWPSVTVATLVALGLHDEAETVWRRIDLPALPAAAARRAWHAGGLAAAATGHHERALERYASAVSDALPVESYESRVNGLQLLVEWDLPASSEVFLDGVPSYIVGNAGPLGLNAAMVWLKEGRIGPARQLLGRLSNHSNPEIAGQAAAELAARPAGPGGPDGALPETRFPDLALPLVPGVYAALRAIAGDEAVVAWCEGELTGSRQHLVRALHALDSHALAEAEAACAAFASTADDAEQALGLAIQARIEAASGRADHARSWLADAVASRPDGVLRVAYAELLEAFGQLGVAAQAYQLAIDADPRIGEAWVGLGRVRWRQGFEAGALAALARAASVAPTDPRPLELASAMYLSAGHRLALSLGARALATEVPAEDCRGRAALDFAEIVAFGRVGAMAPAEAPPWQRALDQRADQAAARLEGRALPSEVCVALAWRLRPLGRDALVHRLLAQVGPDGLAGAVHARALYLRGARCLAAGDGAAAAVSWRDALAADPARWEAAADLMNLLLGDPSAEATQRCQEIADRLPSEVRSRHGALLFNEAVVRARAGQLDRARALLSELEASFGSAWGARVARLRAALPAS